MQPSHYRTRRSILTTPANNPHMIVKASRSNADVVLLDLEDAIGAADRPSARAHVVEALTTLDWGVKSRAVRINPAQSPWCHEDILEIVRHAGSHLDLIVLPKVRAARDAWFVDTLLSQLEVGLDLPRGTIGLELLVEEGEALAHLDEIASSCDRLEALIIGYGDLAVSLGVRHLDAAHDGEQYPGDTWHYARNRLVVAARSNGLDPIDGPNPDFTDLASLRRDARWAASLGMAGKWAIHPGQVDIINDAFSPTSNEIARAKRVLDAAEISGQGSGSLDGSLIDAASVRASRNLLERAHQTTSRRSSDEGTV